MTSDTKRFVATSGQYLGAGNSEEDIAFTSLFSFRAPLDADRGEVQKHLQILFDIMTEMVDEAYEEGRIDVA